MKKSFLIASLALFAVLTAGCMQELRDTPESGNKTTLTVSAVTKSQNVSEEAGTKVSYGAIDATWETGDRIYLIKNDGTTITLTLIGGAGTATGSFSSTDPVAAGTYIPYAVSKSSLDKGFVSVSSGVITLNLSTPGGGSLAEALEHDILKGSPVILIADQTTATIGDLTTHILSYLRFLFTSTTKAISTIGMDSAGGGAERWPDLPEPLSTPYAMVLNGELTLFGGHTDGFLLSQSAWYLKGGAWHEVPMIYAHDHAFCTLLPDGRVMLGGGSAEAFGIGQSWGVEIYDPATHTFSAEGILDRKRAGASALALPGGKVLVSGNWYAPDAMEVYEPGKGFSFLREVAAERGTPFILASAPDNAVVFSGLDNYGKPSDGTVDRLQGDTFHEPLLDEWEPWGTPKADLSIGEYAYLLLARHRESREWGILRIVGEQFSLLETDHPLPLRSDGGGYIWGQLAVDRSRRSAYTLGIDTEGNICVARICYDPVFDGGKAEVTLTEVRGPFPLTAASALLPDGTLVMAGGSDVSPMDDFPAGNNFKNSREVWAFPTEDAPAKATLPWPWFLVIGLLLLTAGALLFRRKKAALVQPEETDVITAAPLLKEQLSKIIEEEELFKQPDLRVTDIAARLATNRTYVSAIIKSLSGDSFSTLVNGYRVRYAQKLMQEHPEMSVTEISEESGFSSRSAFYRNFKDITGLSPAEWKKAARG